jgi:hypothetical protein
MRICRILNSKITPIKRVSSIVIKALLLLALILISLWTLLQLGAVQTFVAKKATNFLSEELQTRVEISRVKFRLLKTLQFEGIYLEDLENDTLLSIRSLEVDLLSISFSEGDFALSAKIDEPTFNLHRHSGDSLFNYQFLIDYFKSDREKPSTDFSIRSNFLEINNGRFSYHDYNIPDTLRRMNYDHIEVDALMLDAKDIFWAGKRVKADIDELSLNSRDDFKLKNFQAVVDISPEQMIYNDLVIRTRYTDLNADLTFTTNDYTSYKNFIDEVLIAFDFRESILDLSDLAYFVPSMTQERHQLSLDGEVKGTVGNLKSDKFSLTLNQDSYVIGEFDIRGLPDLDETFIFFDASELKLNARALKNLPTRSFNAKADVNVPASFERFGEVFFKGNFTGYLNDFVAYGSFSTALGDFDTDISLSQDEENYYYDGSLSAVKFDLAGLLQKENFGYTSFNLDIDGQGVELNEIEAVAIGKINSLYYNDYEYNEIKLNGAFSSKKFKGDLSIRDENLSLDFKGSINADSSILLSKFKLDLIQANLSQLKLFNEKDSLTTLSFNANFDLVGSKIDDFSGTAILDSIDYQDADYSYQGSNIKLSAKNQGEQKQLELKSSFLDANLKGNYYLNDLANFLKAELLSEIPYQTYEGEIPKKQVFEYQLDFKKFGPISKIFLPKFQIDSASSISGYFNDTSAVSRFEMSSPFLAYDRWKLSEMDLTIQFDQQGISTKLTSDQFELARNLRMNDFKSSSHLQSGKTKLSVFWEGINEKNEHGQLQIDAKIDSLDGLEASFYDSYFYLNDSLWSFNNSNKVYWQGKNVNFDSLMLGNANQEVLLDGRLSENSSDSLRMDLKDFNLRYISTFIDSEDLEMEGRINGMAVLKEPYDQRVITSDLLISQIVVNNLNIKEAALQSYWLKDSSGIAINAYIGARNKPLVAVKGAIDPRSNTDNLDLLLSFDGFPIMITEPFIDHILSDLEGELSGDVEVKGMIRKPLLRGNLNLNDAFMHVNYLNTDYRVDHDILIRPDFIGFDLMKIIDENGNTAVATGTIFHQNYSRFNLDVGIETEDFLALNTTESDNELFYGKGIASGWTNISGYADQLIFEMNLTAKDGTDFNIPLKDDVSLSENDFLVFTNSPQYDEDSTIKVDLSGIQLNFDLKIEPEAKVTIIFDPSIGDVITARGEGSMKLEINTLGNFNMFGQYELTQGNYLFTLRNIVNKRFQLSPGSKMMWDGDPYQARLDIEAIYNLRASLYELMPEDSTGRYRRRVPVELILDLGGYLLNPEINFDIKIPDADEFVQNRLQSVLYVNESNVNEQELNQQVFGLLVLNRFMPPSSGSNQSTASRGAPGMNNAYELLSNQLSSWLSSVSNDFDVGVSYRPADEVSQEEIDVSLSTEILNDRLILDGNFGYIADNENVSSERASNFIGEFMVEYKLKRDGRLRVRGFNRSNNDDLLQLNSPYTQGVGIFYREDFNKFSEIWRKYFGKDKIDNEDQPQKNDDQPKDQSNRGEARLNDQREQAKPTPEK